MALKGISRVACHRKLRKLRGLLGICFSHWVNDGTWKESPAGNMSRELNIQVTVTAWKNKPRTRNLHSTRGLKIIWLSPAVPMTQIGLVFFLHEKPEIQSPYERQCSCPEGHSKPCSMLFLPLWNHHARCLHVLRNSNSTAATPEYLQGIYWFFLLSISISDSSKEVRSHGKHRNHSCLCIS